MRGEVFRSGDTLPFGVRAFEGFEPNDLVLYGRTLSLLHGLATRLDPTINVFAVAQPYFMHFLMSPAPRTEAG